MYCVSDIWGPACEATPSSKPTDANKQQTCIAYMHLIKLALQYNNKLLVLCFPPSLQPYLVHPKIQQPSPHHHLPEHLILLCPPSSGHFGNPTKKEKLCSRKRYGFGSTRRKKQYQSGGGGAPGGNGNETEGAQVQCQKRKKRLPKQKRRVVFLKFLQHPDWDPPLSLLPTMSTPSCGGAETIPCSIKVLLLIPFLLMVISRSTCCVGKKHPAHPDAQNTQF